MSSFRTFGYFRSIILIELGELKFNLLVPCEELALTVAYLNGIEPPYRGEAFDMSLSWSLVRPASLLSSRLSKLSDFRASGSVTRYWLLTARACEVIRRACESGDGSAPS